MPAWVIPLAALVLFGAGFGVWQRRRSARLASALLCVGLVIGVAGRLVIGRMSGGLNHLAVVVMIGVPLLVTGCGMVAVGGGMFVARALNRLRNS